MLDENNSRPKKSPVGEYLLFKLSAWTSWEKVLNVSLPFSLKIMPTERPFPRHKQISPFDSPNGGHLKPKKVPLKSPNKVTTWQTWQVLYGLIRIKRYIFVPRWRRWRSFWHWYLALCLLNHKNGEIWWIPVNMLCIRKEIWSWVGKNLASFTCILDSCKVSYHSGDLF